MTCARPLAPSVRHRRLSFLLLRRLPSSVPPASVLPCRILPLPGQLTSALGQSVNWLVRALSALRSVLASSLRSINAVHLVWRLRTLWRSAPDYLLECSRGVGHMAVLPQPFLQLRQHSLAVRGTGFAAPRRIVQAPRTLQRPLAFSLALGMRRPPLGSSYPLRCCYPRHWLVQQLLVACQEVLARPHWSFHLSVLL